MSDKDRFWELVQRYTRLGCLLPHEDDFDTDDAHAMAAVKVVLREMHRTKAEMDALLDRNKPRPPA
jgi:hypothetical protein